MIDNATKAWAMYTYGIMVGDQSFVKMPLRLLEKEWRPECFMRKLYRINYCIEIVLLSGYLIGSFLPLAIKEIDDAYLPYYTSEMFQYGQE